jgi:hypothetical protein
MSQNFLINVLVGSVSVGLISTADEQFVSEFRAWAELHGYRLEVKQGKFVSNGPQHK